MSDWETLRAFRSMARQTTDDVLNKEYGDKLMGEESARRMQIMRRLNQDRNLPATNNPVDLMNRSRDASFDMLSIGGDEAERAARIIQDHYKTAASLNKPDMSTTPFEALRRARTPEERTSVISDFNAIQTPKKPESSFLRTERIPMNGVTKTVDLYGYSGDGGEVITDRKYQDFTPRAAASLSAKEQQTLEKLNAKKQGLESEIIGRHPNVNLDKILAQQEKIPNEPGTGGSGMQVVKSADGTMKLENVETKASPSKTISNWLATIGQIESMLKQRGQAFTPARELARAKLNVPESQNDHQQALEWAKANPNDPMAKRILQLNGVK